MTASSEGVASSTSASMIRGKFAELSKRGILIDKDRLSWIIDSMVSDFCRQEDGTTDMTFGPMGGVGSIYFAKQNIAAGNELTNPWFGQPDNTGRIVHKAVTDGTRQMADDEYFTQMVIAEKSEEKTADGSPIVPRIECTRYIHAKDYLFDVLCAIEGAPLDCNPAEMQYGTRLSLNPETRDYISSLIEADISGTAVDFGDQVISLDAIREINEIVIPLLTMQYLEGDTLIQYLHDKDPNMQRSTLKRVRGNSIESVHPEAHKDESFTLEKRLELCAALCDAVQTFHDTGYVHGDLKPANLFIKEDESGCKIKVLDCGVTRMIGLPLPTGFFLGTTRYAAPEQYASAFGERGIVARPEMDVFALGVMMYGILQGKALFKTRELRDFYHIMQNEDYLACIDPDAPDETPEAMIGKMLYRCLKRDPDQRYSSCAHVSSDIRAIRDRFYAQSAAIANTKASGVFLVKDGERIRVADTPEEVFADEVSIGREGIYFDLAQLDEVVPVRQSAVNREWVDIDLAGLEEDIPVEKHVA